MRELLEGAGYATCSASSGREALALLAERQPSLTLCDWKMPDTSGEQLLQALESEGLLTTMPVIIMTAHGTGPNALQAMQLGAYDFITKPLDMDGVLATVARAIRHMELQREVKYLREQQFRESPEYTEKHDTHCRRLVGSSPAWIEIFKSIGRVAHTDVGVLLLGESGTGKELVARTIHENSARKRKPFIIVNCAALPPDLLESELFGHERGSFTGAMNQKTGKFEAADGGTVFLDEIGELPLALQPKLLRVLQERTFERVGSTATLSSNVRIVAATNRSLDLEVEAKTFRADLFYRLNAFTIQLPPLRSRPTDIVPLAEYFLSRYAERNGSTTSELTREAKLALQHHSFPGNVRELEHLMERLAVQAGGRAVTREEVAAQLTAAAAAKSPEDLAELLALPFHQSVARWEQRLIEHALLASSGNKSDAARRLGIHRRLLYEKLQQLGIH